MPTPAILKITSTSMPISYFLPSLRKAKAQANNMIPEEAVLQPPQGSGLILAGVGACRLRSRHPVASLALARPVRRRWPRKTSFI
ncbi:hypothetical protein J22TS1_06340 [Siminovitchia terrae]|nr:hypothetical protein J22TS1_06340 [Siminovitchia terrae]